MKAAVFRDRHLVADEVPEPAPGKGEVLVKTLSCGICGSDLHMAKHAEQLVASAREAGSTDFIMDLSRDVVMGHEFSAEILDYGVGCKKTLAPGTRVCAMPIGVVGNDVATVGYSNDLPGGFGERMVLQESLLVEIPNGLSDDLAALTEPMAVGVHAVEMARLEPAVDAPLVIGCGPVGLAVISALKQKGAGPIVAADFSALRRELAEQMGADVVLDPGQSSPYQSWREMAEIPPSKVPEGVIPPELAAFLPPAPVHRPGVWFECVGVPGMLDALMLEAPRGARIIVVGVCMERDHVRPILGINKQLNLQFVLGYAPDEFARTLRAIAEGTLQVEPLITGKVGVGGVAGAFEDLANPELHAKVLVEPWR
jgi:threonine dehydrogenase-like Zn-dependent dehydrogenase